MSQQKGVELWSLIQRYLSFDEPLTKWRRLTEKSLFGYRNGEVNVDDNSSRYLNLMLSLEDLSKFSNIAFESWLANVSGEDSFVIPDMETLFPDSKKWLGQFCETSAQAAWIAVNINIDINWNELEADGPWSQDQRYPFLINALESLRGFSSNLNSASVKEARLIFQETVGKHRPILPSDFLPELLMLVEGNTEEMLLPHFSKYLGLDFNKNAIAIITAGGAKQVVRRYLELRDRTKLPIYVLLDADAKPEAEPIMEMLRDNERVHFLSNGELEDIFDDTTLLDLVNKLLQEADLTDPISQADLPKGLRRTIALDRLWKERGLGDFDKVGFAKIALENINGSQQVPKEMHNIVRELTALKERK